MRLNVYLTLCLIAAGVGTAAFASEYEMLDTTGATYLFSFAFIAVVSGTTLLYRACSCILAICQSANSKRDPVRAAIFVGLATFVAMLAVATPRVYMRAHKHNAKVEYVAELTIRPLWAPPFDSSDEIIFVGLNGSIVTIQVVLALGIGLLVWSMRRNERSA